MICNKKVRDAVELLYEKEMFEVAQLIEELQQECYKQTNRANKNSSEKISSELREVDYLKVIRDIVLKDNPGVYNFQSNIKDGFWKNRLSESERLSFDAMVDFRDSLTDSDEELISHIQNVLMLLRLNTIRLFGLEKFNA